MEAFDYEGHATIGDHRVAWPAVRIRNMHVDRWNGIVTTYGPAELSPDVQRVELLDAPFRGWVGTAMLGTDPTRRHATLLGRTAFVAPTV
jgi:hypothetical protein